MKERAANILLVEDDTDYIRLVQRAFRDYLGQFHLSSVGTLKEARTYLGQNSPDLVIADLRLPDGQGTELLRHTDNKAQVPVVVMTGYGDEQQAVEAMKAGALDYIVKSHDHLIDMPHIIECSLREWRHIIDQKRMEEDLRVRLRYEEGLAKCSQFLLVDTDVENPLTEVLGQLLCVSDVSRVYIFENFKDELDGLCMRQINEVCASGVVSKSDNPVLQHCPYKEGFDRWREELFQGRSIGGTVATFHAGERAVLQSQDILSILVLPIWVEGRWYGFIGFDDTKQARQWSDNDIRLLRTASEIIGAYLDRKLAKKRIFKHEEQLRSLASQLSLTEERQRRYIATELHDRIAQPLVFSKMQLDKLRSSMASGDFAKTAGEVSDQLDHAIEDIQNLTYDLGSPTLYELGLAAAIKEWLTEEIHEKHNISVAFEDDGADKQLGDDISAFVLRAVRELLVNVVKHADAENVRVSMQSDDGRIRICVSDDGSGFEFSQAGPSRNKRGGYGLFSIKERLSYIGGNLKIKSKPGFGTEAVIVVPLKGKNLMRGY